MPDLITSTHNARVKQARALRQRKQRDETGLCLVEGLRAVGEAVSARAEIAYLCYAPGRLKSDFGQELLAGQKAAGVPCLALSDEVFAALAGRDNPQGLLAVTRQRWTPLAALGPETFPWGVALVAPQDPGNIGTILRTVDAVGASGLLLLDDSADPYDSGAVRASMGTLFHLPHARATFADFATWAAGHGYNVYGTSAHGDQDYRAAGAYRRPMILLLGSEREGLTPAQQAACARMVRLPMRGRASSLNLAVAAGVILYEMMNSEN